MSSISVHAPARVNIIGEHTDYSGGFVLPTTTALSTRVVAAPRSDGIVEAHSTHFGETRSFALDDIRPGNDVCWIEYVKGVAAELQAGGIEVPAATLEIDSDIPIGGGLSSSASLELCIAKALLSIAGESVESPELAQLCQRAEHRYAKVQCGIMDQYAIACTRKGHAILLDCRSLEAEQFPIPAEARLILTDSGVRHQLPDGHYNNRAEECAEAVRVLQKIVPGLTVLRDLEEGDLEAQRETLGDVLYRRCLHVVNENARVLEAASTLQQGNLERLGELLSTCHDSLRDNYEVSCDEVERLVSLINGCAGILGSRMVGAGFGGCVLALTTDDKVDAAVRCICEGYNAEFGREPWLHVVEPADPAMEMAYL
jgi:galactokinase